MNNNVVVDDFLQQFKQSDQYKFMTKQGYTLCSSIPNIGCLVCGRTNATDICPLCNKKICVKTNQSKEDGDCYKFHEIDCKKVCNNCGVRNSLMVKLLKCSACKKTRYCSKKCQVEDWKEKGHKYDCIKTN